MKRYPEPYKPRVELQKDSSLSPEEAADLPRSGISVVLDNLRSAFNVGSIFRTADAAMAKQLLLCGITACPPNAKLEKTALGSAEYVPWTYFQDTTECLVSIKEEGIPIYSVEVNSLSEPLWEVSFPDEVCLIFGHEVFGVGEGALGLSDKILSIPMGGFKNTMNVATAFGVITYEVLRQHAGKGTFVLEDASGRGADG